MEDGQTCEDIITASEYTMIVDKILDQAKASVVALEERMRKLEIGSLLAHDQLH